MRRMKKTARRQRPAAPAPAPPDPPVMNSIEAKALLRQIEGVALTPDAPYPALLSAYKKLRLLADANIPEPVRCVNCTHTEDEHCRDDCGCTGGLIPNGCLCRFFEREDPR